MIKLKKFFSNYLSTLRNIPPIIFVIFVSSIIVMNILANFTIFQNNYIALDGGIFITWIVATICDIITVSKGPKTTICMSIFGLVISLIISVIFYLFSLIPGQNADFSAFSKILGGTWFIITSSAIAFITSTSLNAFLNFSIGKIFKGKLNGKIYCARSFISTLISQFIDNMIFSIFAYMIFAPIFWNGFSWTIIQVLSCAAVYAGIALVVEIIVSPLAYKICHNIKEE